MRLEPQKRKEMLDEFILLQAKLYNIARELKSERMEDKVYSVSETFYYLLSKDKNLLKPVDVEAEMDDDSGDYEEVESDE